MSASCAGQFRTLAFGDHDSGVWGVAFSGDDQFVAIGEFAPGGAAATLRARVSGASPGEEWTVSGDGVQLSVSALTEPARSPQLEGFDQLCRVSGHLAVAGVEREIDAPGRRSLRSELDFSQIDSIRDVCAWFGPEDGVALTALRPRRANGHESDLVVASLFEPGAAVDVEDPRLSTTYAGDGSPARAGLELWLAPEDEEEQQYPRRAAGEALGSRVCSMQDGMRYEAGAFHWHSRGNDGAGVYLLARRQ